MMNNRKLVPVMRRHSDRLSAVSAPLTATVALLAMLMASVPLGAGASLGATPTSRETPTSLGAIPTSHETTPASLKATPTPIAASATFSLNESGNLHLTSRHGFTLNEQGPASGTVTGAIYVHLKIVSTTHVTAEVNIYPRGGSITGYGTARYRREGATGNFSGSLSINRGTGSYNHARGSGLSFTGTIQRSNYAVTVHLRGRVTD
jgi:hypothetical protein